jgi:hypothetical protein
LFQVVCDVEAEVKKSELLYSPIFAQRRKARKDKMLVWGVLFCRCVLAFADVKLNSSKKYNN